ncbi:MAG: hypothetical protein Q9171_003819 [Xanthocarpia ochracea]
MYFTPEGRGSFRSVSSFLAVLALTGPIHSVLAIPASVAAPHTKRALDVPGLGVELEVAQIIYEPKGKKYEDMDQERREQLKGAIITPIGFGRDHPKENWEITAEISGTNKPFTEIIIDGRKNEIGKHGTQKLGEQITTYMGDWAPCRDKECKVQIEGFAEYNPWDVQWPRQETKFDQLRNSPQVTAAMPLEGLLQVLKDGKDKKDNVLANKGQSYNDKIVIPTKDSFKDFGKIKEDDITDEFLGFFSLLTTYCVVAKDNDERNGPKRSLNIMPRTDFLGMYKKFIEEKLRAEISECGNSLYTIVSTVSGVADDKLKDYEFKWKPDDLRKKDDQDWDGKEDMVKKGRLRVDKFLDTLQMNDKVAQKQLDLLKLMDLLTRHGQIGGLNDRMESVVEHPTLPAPIFEFRDLEAISGGEVAKRMGEYEDKAIEMHKKAKTDSTAIALADAIERVAGMAKRQDVASPGECKPKVCPPGEVPLAATGMCVDVGPYKKD